MGGLGQCGGSWSWHCQPPAAFWTEFADVGPIDATVCVSCVLAPSQYPLGLTLPQQIMRQSFA